MATLSLAPSNSASDIVVTYEDQQKINRFARLNARMEEIKDELKAKKIELQNIEDALSEISIAELSDEGDDVGVKILEGEVFVSFTYEGATTWIEDKKAVAEKESNAFLESIESIKVEMNQLKIALYTKFGKDNINLEAED